MQTGAISVLDAETTVAGSILIDPDSYGRVSELITADDFQLELPRQIFQAAGELSAAGETIDPMTVKERFSTHGWAIGNETMFQYMEVTPTAANDTAYAEIVQQHAQRRRLNALAERILGDQSADPGEVIARAGAELDNLSRSNVGGRITSSYDAVSRFYELLERRETGEKNVVKTGFPSLDTMLGGGFLRGGLYILAARPGMGKTSLALNIADSMEGGVLFVSLEMSADQLTAKRLARLSGISSSRLLMGDGPSDDEYERITPATLKLSKSGVYLNQRTGATVGEIRLMARSVKHLSCIIVDYLGLIKPEQPGSRYETITAISGALKQLAMSERVPVLALAQLNRAAEQRAGNKPTLSDLRDSGAIEQDADGVLLLYRPDYYDRERQDGGISTVELEVAKNRHANTGEIVLGADLKCCRFYEVE